MGHLVPFALLAQLVMVQLCLDTASVIRQMDQTDEQVIAVVLRLQNRYHLEKAPLQPGSEIHPFQLPSSRSNFMQIGIEAYTTWK